MRIHIIAAVSTVLIASAAPAEEAPSRSPAGSAVAEAKGKAPPAPREAVGPDSDSGASGEDEGLSGGEALFKKLGQGGWTMWFMLVLSIAMIATAVERLVNLRERAIVPPELASRGSRLWKEGEYAELQDLAAGEDNLLGRILGIFAQKHDNSPEHLRVIAEETAQAELGVHLRRLRPLSVVAALAPLLGLFGTVLGMIACFDAVEAMGEMGDASVLAGGISQALVTTATGLIIAMPAIAIYHYLKGRTEGLAAKLEMVVLPLVQYHEPCEEER